MADMTDAERQAFEAWADEWGFMNEHHRYAAREAWQASAARSRATVHAVEPLKEEAAAMIESLSAQVVQLRGALAELVAVQELWSRVPLNHWTAWTMANYEDRAAAQKREPMAWAAARAALQGQQGEPTP